MCPVVESGIPRPIIGSLNARRADREAVRQLGRVAQALRQGGLHNVVAVGTPQVVHILATSCLSPPALVIGGPLLFAVSRPVEGVGQIHERVTIFPAVGLVGQQPSTPFPTQRIVVLAIGATVLPSRGARWRLLPVVGVVMAAETTTPFPVGAQTCFT